MLAIKLEAVVKARGDDKSVPCELDRGLEQAVPWQPAVAFVCKCHHRKSAGNASTFAADVHLLGRKRLASRSEEPIGTSGGWRSFPAVDTRETVGLAIASEEETAATDPRILRLDDIERKH